MLFSTSTCLGFFLRHDLGSAVKHYPSLILGIPHSSVGEECTCRAGNPGLVPGLGRSAGKEGIGYSLQYSGLENSMDCMYSPWGHKESATTE